MENGKLLYTQPVMPPFVKGGWREAPDEVFPGSSEGFRSSAGRIRLRGKASSTARKSVPCERGSGGLRRRDGTLPSATGVRSCLPVGKRRLRRPDGCEPSLRHHRKVSGRRPSSALRAPDAKVAISGGIAAATGNKISPSTGRLCPEGEGMRRQLCVHRRDGSAGAENRPLRANTPNS